jgi:hypothetical protein
MEILQLFFEKKSAKKIHHLHLRFSSTDAAAHVHWIIGSLNRCMKSNGRHFMASLNPSNSFASFDSHKVCKLAELYPNDFSSSDLLRLEMQ